MGGLMGRRQGGVLAQLSVHLRHQTLAFQPPDAGASSRLSQIVGGGKGAAIFQPWSRARHQWRAAYAPGRHLDHTADLTAQLLTHLI